MKERKIITLFPTRARAERYARSFDHARRFNSLPVLEVEQTPAGEWAVVNPDVTAKARGPRRPVA